MRYIEVLRNCTKDNLCDVHLCKFASSLAYLHQMHNASFFREGPAIGSILVLSPTLTAAGVPFRIMLYFLVTMEGLLY